MLLWQRAAEARAGTDRDESTVIDRDIAIYQTVNADADSDGPGSDRDRAQKYVSSREGLGAAISASARVNPHQPRRSCDCPRQISNFLPLFCLTLSLHSAVTVTKGVYISGPCLR